MNSSQQMHFFSSRRVESAIISSVFALIFLLGLVGNCLVLFVLLCNGQMNTKTTNMFILNLGLADLCFILFCVPLQATIYAMDEWPFGVFVCKVVHFIIYLTMYTSVLTLIAISLDRYLAICYPLRARELRTPRNTLASIGVVWTLSLVFSSPYLSYYQQLELNGTTVCVPAWDSQHRRAMDICTFVFGYLTPVSVLGLTYASTIRYLWTNVEPMQDIWECQRAKCRVTKMIVIVVILFCLCWLPHHLVILCMWFGHFPLNHTTYVLRILSHLVAYANSCLNPIVYALVSKHFREGFRKVFGFMTRKRLTTRVSTATQVQRMSLVEVGSSDGSNQSDGSSRARFLNKSEEKTMTRTFMTVSVT